MSGLAVVSKPAPAPVKDACLCGCAKSDHNLKHPMGCHKCPCTVFQPKSLALNGGARGDSRSEVRVPAAGGVR